jgi:hypothetical protein
MSYDQTCTFFSSSLSLSSSSSSYITYVNAYIECLSTVVLGQCYKVAWTPQHGMLWITCQSHTDIHTYLDTLYLSIHNFRTITNIWYKQKVWHIASWQINKKSKLNFIKISTAKWFESRKLNLYKDTEHCRITVCTTWCANERIFDKTCHCITDSNILSPLPFFTPIHNYFPT